MTRLYLLKAIDSRDMRDVLESRGQTYYMNNPFGYNSNYGHVIRAKSEEQARIMAASNCGDEGRDVWMDRELTKCTVLSHDGDTKFIMTEYIP